MKKLLITAALAALGSFNCQAQPVFAQLDINNNTVSSWDLEVFINDPTPTTAPAMGGVYRSSIQIPLGFAQIIPDPSNPIFVDWVDELGNHLSGVDVMNQLSSKANWEIIQVSNPCTPLFPNPGADRIQLVAGVTGFNPVHHDSAPVTNIPGCTLNTLPVHGYLTVSGCCPGGSMVLIIFIVASLNSLVK